MDKQSKNSVSPSQKPRSSRSGNSIKNKFPKTDQVELGDLPIIHGKRWYITLSALIAIFGAIVGGVYQFLNVVKLSPLELRLVETTKELAVAQSESHSLNSQLIKEREKYLELIATTQKPALLYPPDGASIIGGQHLFSWDYSKHDVSTQYILEISQYVDGSYTSRLVGVPQSSTKRILISLGDSSKDFYWRIRPGSVVNDRGYGSGPWSASSRVTVFPSVMERIKTTGKLLIASTPTSYDRAISADGKGAFFGYEFEIAEWLASYLSTKLNMIEPLKVELVDIPWDRLFVAIQHGEADMAIRSITRSQAREREYPNLRFTKGYLRNHQIFINTHGGNDFPNSLNGMNVGVKRNSINQKAAQFLSEKYNFHVDNSYTAYADIYQALLEGKISFALVDSVLVSFQLGNDFFQFGPKLDEELKAFYIKELGAEIEEYSVLISGNGSNEKLRKILDAALLSAEFKEFSDSLKKKYRLE